MRIAFWGTPEVAVASLHAFIDADDIDVVCVVTNPDRPRGRSKTPQPSAVKTAALKHGLRVLQPERPRDILDELTHENLDASAVVAYGAILPTDVLQTAASGFVNLHFSLLPRWRGAAPVQWAIRSGDSETGITTFLLDRGMDTGPILAQQRVPIGRDDTTETLLKDLAIAGSDVLVTSVRALVTGTTTPTPQPETGATLAPKITRNDVAIRFGDAAETIDALTRSADPQPGAHAQFRGETLKIFRAAHTSYSRPAAAPGTVVELAKDGPVVACGSGHVTLTSVQLPGKPRRDGASMVHGLRLEIGEMLTDGVTT